MRSAPEKRGRRSALGDASDADLAVEEVAEAAAHMPWRAHANGGVPVEGTEFVHVDVLAEV